MQCDIRTINSLIKSLMNEIKIREEWKNQVVIPDGHIGLTRREVEEVLTKAQGKYKEDFISDFCIYFSKREDMYLGYWL